MDMGYSEPIRAKRRDGALARMLREPGSQNHVFGRFLYNLHLETSARFPDARRRETPPMRREGRAARDPLLFASHGSAAMDPIGSGRRNGRGYFSGAPLGVRKQ